MQKQAWTPRNTDELSTFRPLTSVQQSIQKHIDNATSSQRCQILLRSKKKKKKSLVKTAVCREEKQMEQTETSDVETCLLSDSHLKHDGPSSHSPKLVRKAKPYVTLATTNLPRDHSGSRRKKDHHFLSLPSFRGPDTRTDTFAIGTVILLVRVYWNNKLVLVYRQFI